MLILPLHRPLTRANFPFATLALILVNVFVFVFLQGGDGAIAERAYAQYGESHLGEIEGPAYQAWMTQHERARDAAMLQRMGEPGERLQFELLQSDDAFQRELHADRIVTPEDSRHEAWKASRVQVDAIWARQWTARYVMHYSEFAPSRLFGAMFLHGGAGHLVGNMIFLAVLGLLVEGALGPWLFLALYLLGGLGGQLLSLAWRWGEAGSLLGASGAIASLMGAYCVLWGLRKVRFFWWFFVAFDYVKAPALVLLPFWLGWEVLNLAFNSGAHVAFDVHAGGIACGALLALGVRALCWERRDFLDVEVHEEQRDRDARQLQAALDHLGRLQLDRARPLLQELDARTPGQWPVLQALYRCARYGNDAEALHRTAQAALALVPMSARAGTGADTPVRAGAGASAAAHARAELLREQKALFDDYLKACGGKPRLPPALLLRLAGDALKLGADADAEKLLRALAAQDAALPGLAEAGMALAQRTASTDVRQARLQWVGDSFAQHAVAAKAKFLLSQSA